MATVHIRKGKSRDTSLCGVIHKKVLLTDDPDKVTCPQCRRLAMNKAN